MQPTDSDEGTFRTLIFILGINSYNKAIAQLKLMTLMTMTPEIFIDYQR